MKVLLCSLSDPGFLYPTVSVGLELQARGNNVYLLGRTESLKLAAATGFELLPVEGDGGTGAMSVRFWFRKQREQYLTVRDAARNSGADVLVTSVLCHGALLAAEELGLPIFIIGLMAHLWPYGAGGDDEPELPAARSWRLTETIKFYRLAREEAGFSQRSDRDVERALVGEGLLLRGHPSLEYPGAELPDRVFHVGPCRWEPPSDPDEIGHLLDLLGAKGADKPLVYVHLGRIFQGSELWPRLNAAFTNGKFRAVIEQGRSTRPQPSPAADITLIRKPWMRPLIEMADIVISSGTSASVQEALANGSRLIVAPDGAEQPLLANACVRAGVARQLPAAAGDAAEALENVYRDQELLKMTAELRDGLNLCPGPQAAAEIIRRVLH